MRAVIVTAPRGEVDIASDVLWQLGVRAIEERDAPDDAVELWTAVGEEPDAVARVVDAIAGRWSTRTEDVDTDAAETWREHAEPMWVRDDLVVVPAWLEVDIDAGPPGGPSGTGAKEYPGHTTVVRIEPAGAFGLGDHPTTSLSLRAVSRLIDNRPDTVDLIDVGCGTGVIAITAALRRPGRVRAVDVASAAVEATESNASRNGVADRIVVDDAPLASVDGEYDLVVANILAPTLLALAADLRRLTRTDGRLVISGILADRHDHVVEALAPMIVEQTDVLDGWAAVTLRHPIRTPTAVR